MNIKKSDIICPTCGKKDTWTKDNAFRPFCSDRCKLIDLGAWADEQHRIPGEPAQLDDANNSEDSDEN